MSGTILATHDASPGGSATSKHRVARLLLRFRAWLSVHSTTTSVVRAMRAFLYFGPWRESIRAVIRWRNPVRRAAAGRSSGYPVPAFEIPEFVAALDTDSVFSVGRLDEHFVRRVRAVTDALPRGEFGQFHERNDAVRALVTHPGVVDALREYFGAEPHVIECSIVVGEHRPNVREAPRPFHFDYGGWHALNLFAYFTDVQGPDAAAHEVVQGSHRGHTLRDVLRQKLTEGEAAERFRGRNRIITGPAGTLFFENAEAFHRRRPLGHGRRVLLNVVFASERSVLSRGRNVPSLADHLDARERSARVAMNRV